MVMIREEVLHRKSDAEERAWPKVLHVGVYEWNDAAAGQRGFELRGQDPEGGVHFRFRDPRRLVVLGEFDVTLSDLERRYVRMGGKGNT